MTDKAEQFNEFVRLMDNYEDTLQNHVGLDYDTSPNEWEDSYVQTDLDYNKVISFVRELIFTND